MAFSALEISCTVSFQDDFDNSINHSWKEMNPIPDKYPRYTNFTQISESLEQTMISICSDKSNELLNRIYQLFHNQT